MDTRGGRLRAMRGILYRLKRGYGVPLSVVTKSGCTVDLATGAKATARSAVRVARAVVLPSQVHKSFKYDIGYLRANSNFTYGGLYTEGTREVIVDKTDLPRDFTIRVTEDQYLVIDHKHYVLKKVEDLEVPAYFLTVQWTEGAPTCEVHERHAHERLALTESAAGGVS